MLTVLPEELEAAQLQFGARTRVGRSKAYANSVHGADDDWACGALVIRASDRGTPGAMASTTALIDQFRPDFLILCGIAGGIEGRDGVALGDAVVADYIHYGEYMKLVRGKTLARFAASDQPSRYLQDIVEAIRVSNTWQHGLTVERPKDQEEVTTTEDAPPKLVIGPILSGEKVLSDPRNQIQQGLLDHYDNVIAVEMEAYGFAKAVHENRVHPDYNPQLIVVRGVSDLVRSDTGSDESDDNDDNVPQRRAWTAYAAHIAARVTFEITSEILERWPAYEEASQT